MAAKDGTTPLKRGTPEYTAYMRKLGAKGGRATRDKHPGHLEAIAAMGGKAPRNGSVPKEKPATTVEPTAPVGRAALDFLASIIGEIEEPHG